MDIEIVQDDHIAAFELWRKLSADVGVEGGTVHSAFDDPGSDHLIAAQTGNEGLRLPFAEGRIAHEPLSPWASSAQGRHVGLHTGLVEEDEPRRMAAHDRLTVPDPPPARRRNVTAFFLRCQQRFFYS